VYWAAKDPSAPDEWEDGAAYNIGAGLFAVADGAANSYRSRDWAQSLAANFVHTFDVSADASFPNGVARWMSGCVNDWGRQAPPTTWWEQDAANRIGSAATFLGLHVARSGPAISWSAVSIGDCCLFHWRRSAGGFATFPIQDPHEFTTAPALLSTRSDLSAGAIRQDLRICRGSAEPGDWFLLATDAFAEAMLSHGREIDCGALATIGPEGFRDLVDKLRAIDALQPDDVTLLLVRLTDG